jgi:hypothetical protein
VTRDDILRNMAADVSRVKAAMDTHRTQLARLAADRQTLVRGMIDIAKANGSNRPQHEVGALLGISQQAVSKILGKTRKGD